MKSTQVTPTTASLDHENPHHLCYLTGDEQAVNPIDMALQNQIAKLTGGISPASVLLAWTDWAIHLSISPGKQMDLMNLLQKQVLEWPGFLSSILQTDHQQDSDNQTINANSNKPHANKAQDNRFTYPGWNSWPYNAMSQTFLQSQQFWHEATMGIRGVTAHHENVVNFTARQLLDMMSPSNFPLLNPEVTAATRESGGKNLLSGAAHWMQDNGLELNAHDDGQHTRPSDQLAYQPGRDVALTPGKVILRNHLIELIQYSPQTSKVYAEPILIVPSWIMKYYILDLSPHNSMVRFLVEQGHTVFVISWRNPDRQDRDLGMHDYLELGLYAALEKIAQTTHHQPIHTAGYCLGGTLLAIGAAALAKENATNSKTPIAPIATVSLLAAQTDFREPGELGLFIDESQLAMLDAQMWEQGYLAGEQMAGSFQLLNSRDLVWSRLMRDYQLGIRNEPNDLMSWNADTTRMPYRMHSEYLKHLFLHNDLAEGRYEVNGHAIALNDIHVPMYVVGTSKDHVSPWRSVYKIHFLTAAPIEFVLASGGHNAGIVSEPGHAHRSFQSQPQQQHSKAYADPDEWLSRAQTQQGSWWVHWQAWLKQHSLSNQVKARHPQADPELGDAPGTYIFEK